MFPMKERNGVARYAAFVAALLVGHGTMAGDAANGARLAATRCASCHSSTDPTHATLPLLEGQPKSYFIAQWRGFRNRERTAPVMAGLTAELSETQVEDLAEHYAARVPVPVEESAGSESGRVLADRLQCPACHGASFQGTSAGAARLAGQRARYTAWSLQSMRSGARPHGAAPRPDPLLAGLSNAEIEALASHFASLR